MLRDFILQAKAVSDETRVRILKLLDDRELCVCQLMDILEMGQSTVSKHLGILKTAGLVECRRNGTWTFYSLPDKLINTYNLDFIKLLSSSLRDDALILEDKKRLKESVRQDIKVLCKPDKKGSNGTK
jgi:DNA-binding transcriptional ArsR family regulator